MKRQVAWGQRGQADALITRNKGEEEGRGGLDDGGGGGGVFVCVGVLECVYGGTREQEKWKDDSRSMESF